MTEKEEALKKLYKMIDEFIQESKGFIKELSEDTQHPEIVQKAINYHRGKIDVLCEIGVELEFI